MKIYINIVPCLNYVHVCKKNIYCFIVKIKKQDKKFKYENTKKNPRVILYFFPTVIYNSLFFAD